MPSLGLEPWYIMLGMKENKLTIRIKKPIAEVFEFTINPQNTPTWIDSIAEEHTDTREIQVGTKYTNTDQEGTVNSYQVAQFEGNKIFELVSLTSGYHVRYTYTPISDTETELEYFEWDEVDLVNPFKQEVLEKLKRTMESE